MLTTPTSEDYDPSTKKQPKEASLAKQVMSSAAAARQQSSPLQTPSSTPAKEDDRKPESSGATPGLGPPPSAPPTLVNAIKNMNNTEGPDPLTTLREKPQALASVLGGNFDSPYARSATSTAPGSPRM